MKNRVVRGLLLLALAACFAGAQSAREENPEAGVRKATEEWARYWNTKELDKLTALYASEAVVQPQNRPAVEGRAAIHKFFKGALDSGITDIVHEATAVKASGNRGYVMGRYSLTAPQKDGSKKQDRGKYLQVWERPPGGEWRIVAASFSSDLAP